MNLKLMGSKLDDEFVASANIEAIKNTVEDETVYNDKRNGNSTTR